MLITAIIFIVILMVLVLSHEAGHFFAARRAGVRVEEFGFGIPPRIGGIKKGETLYSFNLLPFGGFVKLHGEEGQDETNPESFGGKPWYARAAILLAGVGANMLVAFAALCIVSAVGIPVSVSERDALGTTNAKITLVEIVPDSPAEHAGMRAGDSVVSISGVAPTTISETQNTISRYVGTPVELIIERGGTQIPLTVTPRKNPPEGEGSLGIALSWVYTKKAVWYQAPIEGARLTFDITSGTISGFATILKSAIGIGESKIQVAGPVGIFSLTGQAKTSGIPALLMFLAILSINLAIINVLPFPGLDGGRLLFVLLETARGKKISSKTSSIVHGTGLAILLFLMLLVTYKDIARIF